MSKQVDEIYRALISHLRLEDGMSLHLRPIEWPELDIMLSDGTRHVEIRFDANLYNLFPNDYLLESCHRLVTAYALLRFTRDKGMDVI